MNSTENTFKEHQELIAHLMLKHMSNFIVMTPITSMRGHEGILQSEAAGPLNEQQLLSLNTIINNTERLQDHLSVFIIATRLMFTPERIYETDCNLLETINISIRQIQKATDFQIDTDLLDNIPEFKADTNLIHQAINCIWRIIKQIHPTNNGQIKITTNVIENLVNIIFSTNAGESITPINENPDLFITQSVAKLHEGELIVDANDTNVNLVLTLSMKALT